MNDNNVLVVEGIHALNPELTAHIPQEQIFRVYASALTTILLDNHNYIPTTDNRLLRRIIRDYKYRGVSAQETHRILGKERFETFQVTSAETRALQGLLATMAGAAPMGRGTEKERMMQHPVLLLQPWQPSAICQVLG